jgi:integrase
MTTMKLTIGLVSNPPKPSARQRRHEIWDSELSGFGLVVSKKNKSFFVFYRLPDGSQHKKVLGNAKVMRLDRARDEAKAILAQVEHAKLMEKLGKVEKVIDPFKRKEAYGAERKAAKITLEKVCQDYMRLEGHQLRSAKERQSMLDRLVFPELGNVPIREIGKTRLTDLFDKIAAETGLYAAGKVRKALSKIFNWYEGRTDGFVSPLTKGLKVAGMKRSERDRVLTNEEISDAWRASYLCNAAFGALVRFLILVPARVSEARQATTDCLDALQNGKFLGKNLFVPVERSKIKLELIYPLSELASAQIDRSSIPYIFSAKKGKSPVADDMKQFRKFLKAVNSDDPWQLRDLRTTGATLMGGLDIPDEMIQRCLCHLVGNQTARTYNRFDYFSQKLECLEKLESNVKQIVGECVI